MSQHAEPSQAAHSPEPDEQPAPPLDAHERVDPSEPQDDAPVEPFDPSNEERDLHEGEADAPVVGDAPPRGGPPPVLKTLQIAQDQTSSIFDYRGDTDPNGGRIALRACVHHIPVISNQDGRGDLDALRRVLLDQGLMVQFGTDAEGNVAMYTRADRLCFHARGGNSLTCGIEHMHFTTDERWLRKQLRAAAWVAQYLEREFDVPLRMAQVERVGPGRAEIVRTGHTSHEEISRRAGFNDRSNPGDDFEYEYVFKAAEFFKQHGHFVGA